MKQTLLCAMLFASASVSQAGIIFMNNVTDGTPIVIDGLSGLVTTGNLLAGMEVTGIFSNGNAQTCTWLATGLTSGGCTAGTADDGGFNLTQDGDTLTNPFAFTNLSSSALLLVLTLNALPGHAIFDVIATPGLTPGSDAGLGVSGTTTSGSPNGLGGYANIVSVGANPALGDLYGQLAIAFGTGLAPGVNAAFLADTDSLAPSSSVPEPITFLLCGVALVAMGLARRQPADPA